ncbi:SRR1-like protein [Hemicordylus capensis]|uniref:SRR1-like protein n=1 Tax=Hemicordylus capensis TaxID=884348 RepID=UPI002303AB65|nr:SRR1-like protein [Hemicordylus capensis]
MVGAAWGTPGGRRRRRRKKKKEEEEEGSPLLEQDGEMAGEQRLRETRAELQSSEFWDSSRRIILKSLHRHLVAVAAAAKETSGPAAGEAFVLALENLQLTPPPAEPTLDSSSQLGADPDGQAICLLCVCYGLGNFSSCVKARYQLAFLILLLEALKIPKKRCYVFDPVFSALEIEVLNNLGVNVLLENEEGKWPTQEPTIFYMIHCGKALYNNLLWRNWSVEALSRMVIIGNSFRGIEERVLSKTFQKDYSYIAKVLMASEEEALPSYPQYMDIFNDTAIHCFPWGKLRGLPQETWTFQEEPVYPEDDQLEIIRKKQ